MRDSDAYEPLLAAMAAAGRHDTAGALALLDQAEATLGPGFHQSREAIVAARAAAAAGEWAVAWGKAHHALCGLTWAFPPDLSTCPPRPGPTPDTGEATACRCGTAVPAEHRFCTGCGTPVAE